MAGTSVLCDGTAYVLVEVRDGYQIWDREDYFSVTPRGCPRHYHPLGEVGEDAAWRSFYELEPVIGAGERSPLPGGGTDDHLFQNSTLG